MKILLIGSGAREHAMARVIALSPLCDELWVAPGNPGIATLNRDHSGAAPTNIIAISANDIADLVAFAVETKISFVVCGPEDPLTLGLYDAMTAAGIACLGPSRAAAALEGSKIMMKDLAQRNNIPTARYEHFTDATAANQFAKKLWDETHKPIVIKTDGLAAGKGVVIAETLAAAAATIDAILVQKKFGPAGDEIIIEEFLTGQELSYFVLSDGTNGVFMGTAEDHKQAFDNDQGPNTGGMGAFTPSPILNAALQAQIERDIVAPTIAGMNSIGAPYVGVLFFGLMVENNHATLLEINIRLGDPEAAVVLETMQTDLLIAMMSAQKHALEDFSIKHWHNQQGQPQTALAVVMAAEGYPEQPQKGQEITLPTSLPDGCRLLHAGTALNSDGKLIASGGRVLTLVATADDIPAARAKIYGAIKTINFPRSFYRSDIGARKKQK
ncbi:MAG: phosphoribosylamine--glycine ligase [Hydrotalea sp.]|nr:phosphoribosylamine--glycine ligase [Hydrotalea sp.]